MKSQTEAILEHLNAGNTLTSLEALDRFGCLRLASRITDIKQLGFDIESTMIKRNNKRFAEYRLLPNKRDLFV